MATTLPVLITPTSITVIFEGSSHTVLSSEINRFHRLRNFLSANKAALADEDVGVLRSILNTDINDSASFRKNFVFKNDTVYYVDSNGEEPLPPVLATRVYDLFVANQDFDCFLNFYNLLKNNPSNRAIQEFYKFLEHRNLPIDSDGYVYAYKAVRSNFYDIHSGKFLNTIGSVLSMPRNKVDDDANRHCSHGFHVGSLEYVRWYGREDSKYLICKFSPEDVVSVPNDHNCQKVRVCKYEVVSEYTGPLPSTRIGASDPEVETFGELDLDDESWIEDFNTDSETLDDEDECESEETIEESPDSNAWTLEEAVGFLPLDECVELFGLAAVTMYLSQRYR